MEDGGISNEELLVAGSDKGYKKVCGGMRFMSEDEKLDGETGREVEVK